MKAKITIEMEFELYPEYYKGNLSNEQMLEFEIASANRDPEIYVSNKLMSSDFIIKGILI